jgi:hypothetical protein
MAIAPGQYLGYSLQVNRLLWHLLEAKPGSAVSLEVLGDVAVRSPSGDLTVEELKSRTTKANPVSDRSVDLWKTIGNWVLAVSSGEIRASTTTSYYTRKISSKGP